MPTLVILLPSRQNRKKKSNVPNELHYQLETLAVTCNDGVAKTALACAAPLLAFYEETKLTVEELLDYLIDLRPVFDFSSSTKALYGWLWSGMNGTTNGKFHFVCCVAGRDSGVNTSRRSRHGRRCQRNQSRQQRRQWSLRTQRS